MYSSLERSWNYHLIAWLAVPEHVKMIAKRSQRGEVIFLEEILRVERSTQVYPMTSPNRQQSFFPRLRGRTTQGVAGFFLLRRL